MAIGSNLGDRDECLRYALRELERRLERLRASRVYRSEPREGARGGAFLNMCVAGRWRADGEPAGVPASAGRLLDELRYVEIGAGRPLRRRRGEPRCLDLDLLLVGREQIRRPGLEVPHPRMGERAFVLRPLAEVLPGWRHPVLGATASELAERCTAGGLEPHRTPEGIP